MTVYLLEAYNTDSRYSTDIRYREYTTSKKRADLFNKIPKIQFSDSGHGICFSAIEHSGHRKPRKTELSSYVYEQIALLTPPKIVQPRDARKLALYKTWAKAWLKTVGLPDYYSLNRDGEEFNTTESIRQLLITLVDEP